MTSVILSLVIVVQFVSKINVNYIGKVEVYIPDKIRTNTGLLISDDILLDPKYVVSKYKSQESVYGIGALFRVDVINFAKKMIPESDVSAVVVNRGLRVQIDAVEKNEIDEFKKMISALEQYWSNAIIESAKPINHIVNELNRLVEEHKVSIEKEEKEIERTQVLLNNLLKNESSKSLRREVYNIFKMNNFYFSQIMERKKLIDSLNIRKINFEARAKYLTKILENYPKPIFYELKVEENSLSTSVLKLLISFIVFFFLIFYLLILAYRTVFTESNG
ncbi:MAG: hypothetical protein GY909_14860 [Oligoflexia bacterium]|nr:hypothetical protein [Oligoflexia bacterium]